MAESEPRVQHDPAERAEAVRAALDALGTAQALLQRHPRKEHYSGLAASCAALLDRLEGGGGGVGGEAEEGWYYPSPGAPRLNLAAFTPDGGVEYEGGPAVAN